MAVLSTLPMIHIGKGLCLRLSSPKAKPKTGIWQNTIYGGSALRRKRIMESENGKKLQQALEHNLYYKVGPEIILSRWCWHFPLTPI